METPICVSGKDPNSKRRWHGIVPVAALVFQLVPPALLWAVSAAAYAEPRTLSEAWERPVSLLVLAFSAGVSLLLGSVGVYGLLTRARPVTALLMIVLCCTPALFAGAVYMHGLLVFLTVV